MTKYIWLFLSGLIWTGLAACIEGSSSRRGGWPENQVAALSPDLREAYDLFAIRCSRCHTLSRPLGAGIQNPEHWRRYVARMRRMPGSGISDEDARLVLLFLEHHAAEVRRRESERGWVEGRFGEPKAPQTMTATKSNSEASGP